MNVAKNIKTHFLQFWIMLSSGSSRVSSYSSVSFLFVVFFFFVLVVRFTLKMEASLLANDTYVPPSLGGEGKGEGDFVGTGFETNSDELVAHQASLRAQQPTTALGKIWCRIRDSLTIQTMLGMSFGFAGGLIVRAAYHNDVPEKAVEIMGYPGEIFMNALTMTVVPLIAVGMVCAVNNLDEFAKLKTMGIRAMKYYLLTTFIAASIGIACVNIFKPGKGQAITNKSKVEQLDSLHKKETMDAFLDVGRSMTLASKGDQGNLINGLLNFNILGVIVFFLMFGVFLAKLGERGKQVANMFSVINDTLMGMVNLFIVFTPFGICSLVMSEVAKQANLWGILGDLAMFTVTCVVGTIMQVVINIHNILIHFILIVREYCLLLLLSPSSFSLLSIFWRIFLSFHCRCWYIV